MASETEIVSIELLAVDAQLILAVKFPLYCGASRSVLTSTSIICTSFDASFIT